jgi:hypothetical protein
MACKKAPQITQHAEVPTIPAKAFAPSEALQPEQAWLQHFGRNMTQHISHAYQSYQN